MKLVCAAIILAAAAATSPAMAGSTLYAADNLTNGVLSGVVYIDKATLANTGSVITETPVTGVATDGTSVYVSQPDGISRYDGAGNLSGQYANGGIDHFDDLALSGHALYASDNLTNGVLSGVVTLDAASMTETSSFLTSGHVAGLATDGTDIFTSLPNGISEYTLAGTLIRSFANVGIDNFGALSFADGILYAADNLTNGVLSGVVMFDGSLTNVGSFLSTGHVAGLASDGTNIFLSLPDGITRYDTAGNVTGTFANVGIDSFGALALASPGATVPEPATWSLLLIGFGAVGRTARRRSVELVAKR